MIKRLRKGFTIVELVVVIAAIAVLAAIIAPGLNNGDALREAAASTAEDFYAATQSLFTKYSRYEAPLSLAMKNESKDTAVIGYASNLGGNYPTKKYIFIEVAKKATNVSVKAVGSDYLQRAMTAVLNKSAQTDTVESTVFDQTFANNLSGLIELKEGYYYAVVKFEEPISLPNDSRPTVTNTVRVMCTGWSQNELPQIAGDFENYKQQYLLFKESNRLANGSIFGVCSSVKCTVGSDSNKQTKLMGEMGTYFAVHKNDASSSSYALDD